MRTLTILAILLCVGTINLFGATTVLDSVMIERAQLFHARMDTVAKIIMHLGSKLEEANNNGDWMIDLVDAVGSYSNTPIELDNTAAAAPYIAIASFYNMLYGTSYTAAQIFTHIKTGSELNFTIPVYEGDDLQY